MMQSHEEVDFKKNMAGLLNLKNLVEEVDSFEIHEMQMVQRVADY